MLQIFLLFQYFGHMALFLSKNKELCTFKLNLSSFLKMADGIGAAQAAAELAQAAGRNASAYANGGDGDSDGPDLDAVNVSLIFEM